jgi:2-dehydro-3-deoxy-D-arabinonate dehydratase
MLGDPMTPISIYRTAEALVAQRGDVFFSLGDSTLDALFTQVDPARWLEEKLAHATPVGGIEGMRAPIQSQEVWAAGVTYLRSRDARIEESEDAGGGTFYDRVYDAERPEIFFKATPHRVAGNDGLLTLRSDAKWNVPEPELALAINAAGTIFGYTIGNDLSSRDIEGENPLYLPQAKVWSLCCGLGPALVVREPLPRATAITVEIERAGAPVFRGVTALDQMKRALPELAEFLYRDNAFPHGCYLLTGTGIVPPNDFTLASGDAVRISIDGLGTLINWIA